MHLKDAFVNPANSKDAFASMQNERFLNRMDFEAEG